MAFRTLNNGIHHKCTRPVNNAAIQHHSLVGFSLTQCTHLSRCSIVIDSARRSTLVLSTSFWKPLDRVVPPEYITLPVRADSKRYPTMMHFRPLIPISTVTQYGGSLRPHRNRDATIPQLFSQMPALHDGDSKPLDLNLATANSNGALVTTQWCTPKLATENMSFPSQVPSRLESSERHIVPWLCAEQPVWPHHNPACDYGSDAVELGLCIEFRKYIKIVRRLFTGLCDCAYRRIQNSSKFRNAAAEIQALESRKLVWEKITRPVRSTDPPRVFSQEAFDNIFLPGWGLHVALSAFVDKILDKRALDIPVEQVVIREFQSGILEMDNQAVQAILRNVYWQAMKEHRERLRQDVRNLTRTGCSI